MTLKAYGVVDEVDGLVIKSVGVVKVTEKRVALAAYTRISNYRQHIHPSEFDADEASALRRFIKQTEQKIELAESVIKHRGKDLDWARRELAKRETPT